MDQNKMQIEAHATDVYVGRQVTIARRIRNCSLEKLGDHLDLSFEQIRKYESGRNRISAGKLFQIAAFLNQPLEFFFPDRQASLDAGDDIVDRMLALPAGLEIATAVVAIPSATDRRLVADFAQRLAPPAAPLLSLVERRKAHA